MLPSHTQREIYNMTSRPSWVEVSISASSSRVEQYEAPPWVRLFSQFPVYMLSKAEQLLLCISSSQCSIHDVDIFSERLNTDRNVGRGKVQITQGRFMFSCLCSHCRQKKNQSLELFFMLHQRQNESATESRQFKYQCHTVDSKQVKEARKCQ